MNSDTKILLGVGLLTILVVLLISFGEGLTPSADPYVATSSGQQLGDEAAGHTLVEFSDFLCPACKTAETFVKEISEKQKDLKIVYRHFPLPQHPLAFKASLAAEAAGRQGRFWPYKEKLFQNQENLSEDSLERIADELGLDLPQFREDLDSAEILARVQKDLGDGQKLGVSGTPTFFLDGEKLQLNSFANLLEEVSRKASQ